MSTSEQTSPLTKPKHYNLEILLFSSIRILVHAMMRMVYPFLAVFGRGLGVDLTTISLAVTIRNFAAILVPLITSIFDKRSRRSGMLTGMGLFILGCAVVTFWPTFIVFILALSLTFIGMHVFVASMQAYQSDTIPLPIRGQAIVITSTGWALSFVVAVPLLGFLIGRFGWLSPFPVMGVLGVISIFFLLWLVPRGKKAISSQAEKVQHGILQVFTSSTAIAGVLDLQTYIMDLVVDAAVTGDRQAALEALIIDPNVPSPDVAEKILDEMLIAQAGYLPTFA